MEFEVKVKMVLTFRDGTPDLPMGHPLEHLLANAAQAAMADALEHAEAREFTHDLSGVVELTLPAAVEVRRIS